MNINDWYNLLFSIYIVCGICYALAFGLDAGKAPRIIMIFWILIILIFTANRPIDVGTDTQMYANIFELYSSDITYDYIPVHQQLSYFFYIVGKFASAIDKQFSIFVYCISGLFLASVYYAFKLIFGQKWHFPFFFFSSTFIYYSFLFNLIRNSLIVGGVFFVLYLFFFNPTAKRRVIGLILIVVLSFIHSSAGFVGLAILGSSFLKSEKQAFVVWFLTLTLAIFGADIFHYVQTTIISLFPNSALGYKTGVYDRVTKTTGFRVDFVLFTFLFGVVGYFVSVNWKNPFYANLVKWYLIQGSIFMLFFSFPYVDRIACLAWMGFPLIIGYPAVYWQGFKPYKLQIAFLTFLFGILNLILVARYDFHLELF